MKDPRPTLTRVEVAPDGTPTVQITVRIGDRVIHRTDAHTGRTFTHAGLIAQAALVDTLERHHPYVLAELRAASCSLGTKDAAAEVAA